MEAFLGPPVHTPPLLYSASSKASFRPHAACDPSAFRSNTWRETFTPPPSEVEVSPQATTADKEAQQCSSSSVFADQFKSETFAKLKINSSNSPQNQTT